MLLNVDVLLTILPVGILIGVSRSSKNWCRLLGNSVNGFPCLDDLKVLEVVLDGRIQIHFVIVDDLVLFFNIECFLRHDIFYVLLLIVVVLLVVRANSFRVRIFHEAIGLSLSSSSLFRGNLG